MRRHSLILLVSVIALYIACECTSTAQERVVVAIVVNRSNKIGDMTLTDVRKLFLGEKGTWPNGRRVILLMSPTGSPQRAAVLRQIYKMNESEFSKYVLQSAFTGRQLPLREVAAGDMKKTVAERPEVIGYLPITEVDAAVRPVLVIR